MAVKKYSNARLKILYCHTLKYEHPDNLRFLREVEQWIQWPIKILRNQNPEYNDEHGLPDIFRVFDATGWLVGPNGARCSTELKKRVRFDYQWPDDLHLFGLCADEKNRISLFEQRNPELKLEWMLLDSGTTKRDCLMALQRASIRLPELYRKGYRNNNCIGCVKGQMGYWNKIRVDYPDVFARMAAQERKMGVACCKRYEGKTRIPVFLDELPPDAGDYEGEPDIECGPQCVSGEPTAPEPKLHNDELRHGATKEK